MRCEMRWEGVVASRRVEGMRDGGEEQGSKRIHRSRRMRLGMKNRSKRAEAALGGWASGGEGETRCWEGERETAYGRRVRACVTVSREGEGKTGANGYAH